MALARNCPLLVSGVPFSDFHPGPAPWLPPASSHAAPPAPAAPATALGCWLPLPGVCKTRGLQLKADTPGLGSQVLGHALRAPQTQRWYWKQTFSQMRRDLEWGRHGEGGGYV